MRASLRRTSKHRVGHRRYVQSMNDHRYALALEWEGNLGSGTARYDGYSRQYRVSLPGKAPLVGTADPSFRGDAALHNPEELLLAAASGCHLLSFLALAARAGIRVTAYRDAADGVLKLDGKGGGAFSVITLRPTVTVAAGTDVAAAYALHDRAGQLCFIARSCNFPIRHEVTIEVEA